MRYMPHSQNQVNYDESYSSSIRKTVAHLYVDVVFAVLDHMDVGVMDGLLMVFYTS